MMKGEVFILSAPAGGGKTTIANLILKEVPNIVRITTYTTRKPREGERHGLDYFFLTKEEFETGIKQNRFLEYAIVHGNYYGTPREELEKQLNTGNDVILVIDVQGMRQIKNNMPSVNSIFILPPSLDELIYRMKVRGESVEEIKKRLETAKKEISAWKEYNYIVINDILEKAKEDIKKIILTHRLKMERFDIGTINDDKLQRLLKNG